MVESSRDRVTIARAGRGFELTATQWVPQPVDRVFAFFADPLNLERITPPFLRFHVRRRSTPDVREGTRFTYTLQLHGVPVLWRTRIEEWQSPHRFVDVQLLGPYAAWRHTHRFATDGNGTKLEDEVRYRLRCSALQDTPLLAWVHRDVQEIFRYRQRAIRSELGGPA